MHMPWHGLDALQGTRAKPGNHLVVNKIHARRNEHVCEKCYNCPRSPLRRVLGIPYKTHTALLGPIIDSCHVSIVLVKRFCKFVDSMLASDNEIVKVIITNAIVSAQSPIGMNIAILRNMYAIRVRNVNFCYVYKQAMHQPWSTVDVTPDSQFVKELLRVRNNESYLCDFTINEISALIECVCVT